jgi:hypothetical protein
MGITRLRGGAGCGALLANPSQRLCRLYRRVAILWAELEFLRAEALPARYLQSRAPIA